MNRFSHEILSWTFALLLWSFLFHFFTLCFSYSLLFCPFLALVGIQLIETGGHMTKKDNGFSWCSFNCQHSVIFLHFCLWICNFHTYRNQSSEYLRWNTLYFAELIKCFSILWNEFLLVKNICAFISGLISVFFFKNSLDLKCISYLGFCLLYQLIRNVFSWGFL